MKSDNDFTYSTDSKNLAFSFGYFLEDQHEIGINHAKTSTKANIEYYESTYSYSQNKYITSKKEDEEKISSALWHLFYIYYIPVDSDKWIPYIGAQLGAGGANLGGGDVDLWHRWWDKVFYGSWRSNFITTILPYPEVGR